MFPLAESLGAGPAVVGEALVMVLLKDLHGRNEGFPSGALASQSPPGFLKGSVTLDHLCEDLATRDSFPAPLTFASARLMVTQSGLDPKDVLMAGPGVPVLPRRKVPGLPQTETRPLERDGLCGNSGAK